MPVDHMMPVMGSEPKQVPTTMYGDPILSSEHVRSASHDSGLGGPTNFPYQSETPMIDYDDPMDTSAAMKFQLGGGMRVAHNHRSLDYLNDMPGDVESSFPEPNPAAMDTELLPGTEVFNENMGQWV